VSILVRLEREELDTLIGLVTTAGINADRNYPHYAGELQELGSKLRQVRRLEAQLQRWAGQGWTQPRLPGST